MSASFEASLRSEPVPPPDQQPYRATPLPVPVDRAHFRQRLRTVQDMLEDLEEQTAVGRRHTLEKVLGVLRDHVQCGAFRTNPRNHQTLSALVAELTRQAARALPAVETFRDHAEPLVALLMATT